MKRGARSVLRDTFARARKQNRTLSIDRDALAWTPKSLTGKAGLPALPRYTPRVPPNTIGYTVDETKARVADRASGRPSTMDIQLVERRKRIAILPALSIPPSAPRDDGLSASRRPSRCRRLRRRMATCPKVLVVSGRSLQLQLDLITDLKRLKVHYCTYIV